MRPLLILNIILFNVLQTLNKNKITNVGIEAASVKITNTKKRFSPFYRNFKKKNFLNSKNFSIF